MSNNPFRVGLLGHGTVGAAFKDLLEARAEAIEADVGRRPEIAGVLTTRDGDFAEILERSDLVVELMGGTDPARDYVLRAMEAGRHVVTANKQLLSQFGEELFVAARKGGVQLRFEAAVAGVVPAIRVIAETLAAAHIERVHGIVNGTTNYILTEMARTGATYEEALAAAGRGAADRHRRGVLLLPPPGGGRPPWRAGAGGRDTRHAGGVDQVGRAEGPRRGRPAGDGHAPGARVEVPGGSGADLAARLRALGAAGDPGDRGGVRGSARGGLAVSLWRYAD